MVVYGAANGRFNARWQSIDDWSFRRITPPPAAESAAGAKREVRTAARRSLP